MANELRVATQSGVSCYFQVWNAVGQIYSTVTGLFAAYATAQIGNYDLPGTEQGTASGVYLANMPGIAEGLYSIDARQRIGGSPAESDPVIGSNVLQWNGTAFNLSTVQAKITVTDDNAGSEDLYIVVFYKNSQPYVSGVTSPTLRVYDALGSNLIATTALTQIGATGTYKYTATGGERIVAGTAYVALASATVDGVAASWYQPVSRDST